MNVSVYYRTGCVSAWWEPDGRSSTRISSAARKPTTSTTHNHTYTVLGTD